MQELIKHPFPNKGGFVGNKPSRSKQLEATKMAGVWQLRNESITPRHEVQKAYDSLTAAGVVLNGFWHPTTALLKRLTARLEQAN